MEGGKSVTTGSVVYYSHGNAQFWELWLAQGVHQPYIVQSCSTIVTFDPLAGRNDLIQFPLQSGMNQDTFTGSLVTKPQSAWRARLDLHRAALPDGLSSHVPGLMDQILIQQIKSNVTILRVHRWKPAMIRLIKAVLSLHLGRDICRARQGRLFDFFPNDNESFGVLIEQQWHEVSILNLVHDPTFFFDLGFADEQRCFAAESSDNLLLGPRDRRLLRTQDWQLDRSQPCRAQVVRLDFDQLMMNAVTKEEWEPEWPHQASEVAKVCQEGDPSSMILKTDFWRFLMKWHLLSRHANPSPFIAIAQQKFRAFLIQTLNQEVQNQGVDTSSEVAFILNILGLSIGAKAIFGVKGSSSNGCLEYVSCESNNMAVLYLVRTDKSLVLLTVPIEGIPFLWQNNQFLVQVDPNLILPRDWFGPREGNASGGFAPF